MSGRSGFGTEFSNASASARRRVKVSAVSGTCGNSASASRNSGSTSSIVLMDWQPGPFGAEQNGMAATAWRQVSADCHETRDRPGAATNWPVRPNDLQKSARLRMRKTAHGVKVVIHAGSRGKLDYPGGSLAEVGRRVERHQGRRALVMTMWGTRHHRGELSLFWYRTGVTVAPRGKFTAFWARGPFMTPDGIGTKAAKRTASAQDRRDGSRRRWATRRELPRHFTGPCACMKLGSGGVGRQGCR